MSKFTIKKKLDLDQYGKGSYIVFKLLTFKEIRGLAGLNISAETTDPNEVGKALDKVTSILQSNFIEGKLPDDKGELVEVKKEDLGDLPVELIGDAMGFLSGGQTKA